MKEEELEVLELLMMIAECLKSDKICDGDMSVKLVKAGGSVH